MKRSLIVQCVTGALSLLPLTGAADARDTGTVTPASPAVSAEPAGGVMEMGTMEIKASSADLPRAAIDSRTGTGSFHFNQKAIDNLPQGRNSPLKSLLLQAPGVAQDTFGQLHVRGDHGDIQYRINGIIIPESIGGFGNAFGTRFIDHVDFLTGTLPAEYGYRTAGIVDITTKGAQDTNGGVVSMYGGSYNTLEPALEFGGSKGRWNYYLSGTYLQNDIGIEPPTCGTKPIHDTTKQNRAFGYTSFLLNEETEVGAMFGHFLGNFQIPNDPAQNPAFQLAGVSDYPSSALRENQREVNDYGILYVQGLAGTIGYQVSLFTRYSSVHYYPDSIGDLIYNGVSSQVLRRNVATGIQADASFSPDEAHTVRWGVFALNERTASDNTSAVFPTDANGNQSSNVPKTIVDNSRKTGGFYSAYIQDRWLVVPSLTVNYGLRYDLNNGYAREDQLSPRVNAVYALDRRTRLHAGYARYFTPPPLELIAPTDIALFQGSTNALPSNVNTSVKAERDNYYDVGLTRQMTAAWRMGLDGYYKDITDLLDQGQFGQAQIFSPFNYAHGKIWGVQFTTGYRRDNFSSYFNLAMSRALGKDVVSGQYNFDPAELQYIATHYVHLDHDQLWTASGGVAYNWLGTHLSLNGIYGSGLRRGFANTGALPAYYTFNLGATRSFRLPGVGAVGTRFTVVNLLDQVYELRDGTGIGVGSPHYGPRRGFYAALTKSF